MLWWTQPWFLAVLLVIMTATAYLPVLRAGFIWDDDDYVTENVTLRSADGLRRIWCDVGATYQYYPLVHTTFWIEYHLWKLKPFGFHLVNILLHALGSVLLWRVLVRLKLPGAWLASAIFALHPVMVESVAWVTERKNVLSGVFYFAAALSYLRFLNPTQRVTTSSMADASQSRWRWYAFSLLLFVCALLSKTVACSLPAALLLVLWWKYGRLGMRDVLPTLPFFTVGVVLGLFTAWVEKHHVGAVGVDWALTCWQRCLIAGRALWFYAAKLVWPTNLTFIYSRWEISATVWWQWLFPSMALVVVAVLFLARSKFGRGPLVAVLFFGGTLLPALGFINVYPMRYSFVADHFQYLASVGLIILAAAGLARLSFRYGVLQDKLKMGVRILLLASLGILTWRQTHIYHDLEVLWRDTISKNPACWLAYNNLGEVFRARGELDKADQCYRDALSYKPDHAEALNNLGYGLFERGRFEEASDYYLRAIEAEPRFAPAWSNLGAVLVSQGQMEAAIEHLRHALLLDGNSADAMNNLAIALTAKNQYTEAIALCQTVIQFHPDRSDTRINLANVFMSMGRVDDAISSFREALRLDPCNVKAHTDIAAALAANGRTAEGAAHYARAVQLTPTNATLHYNLGVLLAASGRTPEAVQQFREAVKINPEYPEANNNLGVSLSLAGEFSEAARLFAAAIKSKPDYAEAHNNLAFALIKLGRSSDAIEHLREALRINPNYQQAKDQLRALEVITQ